MNKSKIEWCDSTWNPVTGCLHGCTYCYAEKIANRFAAKPFTHNKDLYAKDFTAVLVAPTKTKYVHTGKVKTEPYPFGFLPTFHKYRLNEPKAKTKPQNIFVCSMADLFGDWVPDEWLEKIYLACQKAGHHRYIFLTKNPKRYRTIMRTKLDFRYYMWFGTTINIQKDISRHSVDIMNIPGNLFLSIEPLHGKIDLTRVETPDGNGFWNSLTGEVAVPFTIINRQKILWVIVGAQTGSEAKPPEPEWVQSIISQCRAAKIPLFLKNNLNWPMKIQEFPWDKGEGER